LVASKYIRDGFSDCFNSCDITKIIPHFSSVSKENAIQRKWYTLAILMSNVIEEGVSKQNAIKTQEPRLACDTLDALMPNFITWDGFRR
jgi:hypothetical protein